MAAISIDVESNQADLNTLVNSANAKIGELQAILSQITAFQLAFTVNELPATPPADAAPSDVSEINI